MMTYLQVVETLDLIRKNSEEAVAKLGTVEVYKLQSDESAAVLYEAIELFAANIVALRSLAGE
ncbi:MAG: hypothetical protein PHX83_06540 [Acidobacteriia bacterium]|nr:hypothetical protein [Terriglobia bacterium]